MAITLQHKDLTLELFDDSVFIQTPDSPTKYDIIVQADKDKQYSPTSQHAIKIYRHNNLIRSAIILGTGGGTGVHSNTALIDDDNLIERCCNKLFSLTLPDLEINWITEVDWATCFSIHRYQDTYISHGEMSIKRITRDGKELWSFGGRDIFVCLNEGSSFEMHESHIDLTDFEGYKYKIDYNGNSLNGESRCDKQEKIIVRGFKKQWWKFW